MYLLQWIYYLYAAFGGFDCSGEMTTTILYPIDLVRVIDGDTIIVNIPNITNPKPFNILSTTPITLINQKVRLFGIDAPAIFGNEKLFGFRSRNYLELLIQKEKLLLEIHYRFYEKYGRLIGTIFATGYETPDININQLMIKEGYAFPATYIGGKYRRTPRHYSSPQPLKTQFTFA